MLRETINKHIKPRIAPFQLTAGASSTTVDIGYGDFTATRVSDGIGLLTPRQGYSRNALIFLSQQTTTGGYAAYPNATPDSDLFEYSILNTAGTLVNGTCEGFTFGWDSSDLSLCKSQRVAAVQNYPRCVWGKITGTTGAVAIGKGDFSCTRSAAGTYVITFKNAFRKTPIVMVTGSGNTSTTVANAGRVTSKTASSVTIIMAPESGTPTDGDFYILAIGSDSRSDSARGRMPLQNSQRKPRIVAGQITVSSGTPTLAIGGATGGTDFTTLTDIGTGNFSVKIAESFIREPAIFLTCTTQRCEVKSYSAGTIDIKTKAANGNDTDLDGVINIFVIGSDVNEEF